MEQWFRNTNDDTKTLNYRVSERDGNNWSAITSIAGTNNVEFGENNEVVFVDWDHNTTNGEPRDVIVDFNQTLSHVVVENPGFGYSLPVSVQLIGGYPTGSQIEQWFDDNESNVSGKPLPYQFEPAIVEVDEIDPTDGSIISFDIINPGKGYIQDPEVVITGGGGNGAKAEASRDVNGSIIGVQIEFDLENFRFSFGSWIF